MSDFEGEILLAVVRHFALDRQTRRRARHQEQQLRVATLAGQGPRHFEGDLAPQAATQQCPGFVGVGPDRVHELAHQLRHVLNARLGDAAFAEGSTSKPVPGKALTLLWRGGP